MQHLFTTWNNWQVESYTERSPAQSRQLSKLSPEFPKL